MAIVDWETLYKDSANQDINFLRIEINDQTNAIRRAHWNVQPGVTLHVQAGPPANIDVTFEATAQTGVIIGDQNIPGNIRLIETTDADGTYLEPPFTFSAQFSDNGLG